ncbi:MAG TPA: T9SS type A sorting domain-containing protein [Bacteroidia bacterium]|nr:T9SS type A sorting domain-containing protein [Bacteroidia bacterium]
MYATGNFQSWSGNPSNYLSKWDEVMWQAMPYPTGGQNSIIDACIFENNFYLVGYFTNPPDLAIWNGSQYDSLGNIYGFAKTYTIYKNELYVMGSFLNISNHVCNSIAKLNSLHIGVEELNPFIGTINIFPNPVTSNEIFIQSPDVNLNLENASVRLFNLQGKLMLSDKIRDGVSMRLKNGFISPGIYFLQLIANNYTFIKKIEILYEH